MKKHPLAWNGGEKPKKPTEGFATEIGLTAGVIRKDREGHLPKDRTRKSGRIQMPKE